MTLIFINLRVLSYLLEHKMDIYCIILISDILNCSPSAPVHFKVRSRKELERLGRSELLRFQSLGDLPISLSWRKEGSFFELQGRIRYIKKELSYY
jgi:hypothetical protein